MMMEGLRQVKGGGSRGKPNRLSLATEQGAAFAANYFCGPDAKTVYIDGKTGRYVNKD